MTTNVPAPRPRHQFPEISAVSWEHPADRAALQALRAVPGVDEVIRKVLALLGGERGVRLLFQGNAIRVGPTQFPRLWHLHTEVTTTFDWPDVSELSADRAGLLGGQDVVVAQRVDMKMAGGGRGEGFAGQLNVDAFMEQAHEYANTGEGLDIVYKLLSTLALTHPMHTVRAAELQRWVASGDYDRILRGEYVRRGPESADRPLRDDMTAAGNYYAGEA